MSQISIWSTRKNKSSILTNCPILLLVVEWTLVVFENAFFREESSVTTGELWQIVIDNRRTFRWALQLHTQIVGMFALRLSNCWPSSEWLLVCFQVCTEGTRRAAHWATRSDWRSNRRCNEFRWTESKWETKSCGNLSRSTRRCSSDCNPLANKRLIWHEKRSMVLSARSVWLLLDNFAW